MLHLRRLNQLAKKAVVGGISAREEVEVFSSLASLSPDDLDGYEKHYPPPKPAPEPPAALPSNPTIVTRPLSPDEEKHLEAKRAKDPEYQRRRKLAEDEAKKAAKKDKK